MDNSIRLVKKQQRELISLASRLIEIPTVNPPGINYERMVDFIEAECRDIGLKTTRYIAARPAEGSARINLVARWNTGRHRKTLHINSHYDVVPATENWHTDPFIPVIKNGRLYGRGSEDMKANIAAVLTAVRLLRQQDIMPGVNLELSFTPDEETGGAAGLEYLVKKKLVQADYALGEGYSGEFAAVGNKGMLWLEVDFQGKSAHGSQPSRGRNAFEGMNMAAAAVFGLARRLNRKQTRFGVRSLEDARPSLVCGGVVSGGHKVNIVPGRSSFSIDRRLIPEETTAKALCEIEQVLTAVRKRNPGIKYRVKVMAREEAVVSSQDEVFYPLFSECVRNVLKKKLKPALMTGGTDLRHFIRMGIPSIGYSVGGGDRAHADNEFVSIKSLIETTAIFTDLIKSLN